MGRKKRELGLQEQVGDMTSMIDVVFLLLIFFILMPFKTSEARIESHLPKNSGRAPTQLIDVPVDKITIEIKVDKTIPVNIHTYEGINVRVNGKKISFVGIKAKLAELHAGLKIDASKVPVELNADQDVPFYFILKALDYAKLNNFYFIKYPPPPASNGGKHPRRNQ